MLVNYLNANLNSKDINASTSKSESALNLIKVDLINYQDLFFLKNKSLLYLRGNKVEFDREKRDSYELFISFDFENEEIEEDSLDEINQFIYKHKHLIPSRIRIMILITDSNDNKPQFNLPYEVKYTKKSTESHDLFYYNKTIQWSDLINSTKEKY